MIEVKYLCRRVVAALLTQGLYANGVVKRFVCTRRGISAMAFFIVTMATTRLRLFAQTAHCLACTCAGMAVGVLRLSGFVMEFLIALTAPMSLTLGQTAL